ncbi:cupin domain-containing protein [Roseomonas sp. BN140053]|uniref:cupin domain-containing protein n=1 Tax=Roseomonas sp. BN140053 TaxID=3391898 RepID=UPI0039E7CFEC
MKIVAIEEVPMIRGLEHRKGGFRSQTVLEGTPGTPGNFKFSVSEVGADFYSPRHRHNFDQFRYVMQGTSDFEREGRMKPGMLGYFPEGTPYGAQTNPEPCTMAVLQFGGASGSGYLLPREVKAAMKEVEAFGEFRDGMFFRHGETKPGRDAYQAIWEHRHGRRMTYPKPRFTSPVFMASNAFTWTAREDEPGVSEKLLGVFGEGRTEGGLLRIEPGAQAQLAGHGIWFVLDGRGEVASRSLDRHGTVYLERGETVTLRATETTELLHYGLPRLSETPAVEAEETPEEELVLAS